MIKPLLIQLEQKKKFQRLLQGVPATCGMKAGHVVLKPGESVGAHSTLGKEEALIILRGKAGVVCGESRLIKAKQDMFVYIPSGIRHDVKNTGKGVLEYIYVTVPVK